MASVLTGLKPYSKELAEEICELIASNPISLEKILATDNRFPSRAVFFVWMFKHEELQDMYIKAKQAQIHCAVDEADAVAVDDSKDLIQQPDGKITCNTARVARHKLIVDTKKWSAARLMPRVYGDRTFVQNENSNEKLQPEDKAKLAEIEASYKSDL